MSKPWLDHYESAVPRTLTYPQFPLQQILKDSARRFPDHPAIHMVLGYAGATALGARLTYHQLLGEVDRFAAALHALGVRKGDRVALMLPNLPQFVVAFFGALKIGAIVVNTNPQYTPREIEGQFSDAGAETVVLLSPFYQRLKTVQAHTAVKRVIVTDVSDYLDAPAKAQIGSALRKDGLMADIPAGEGVHHFRPLLAAHPEPPPHVEVAPSEVALFQYTGGTTGEPKAAMLTHANLVANTLQMRHWLAVLEEGQERLMGAIPFYHVYGMTVAMTLGIFLAGELILTPNPRPIEKVMEIIHREKATVYPGVPTMYIGIINHPDVAHYDLRSVKACISGAAPLPMDVQVKFGELTGGRLVEGYGLTEASPVTHCNPVNGERRAGAIGLPLPDVDAKIMDYERLTEKPSGENGELWVRGPQVMLGYRGQPDETAQTITTDGWLRTGDIGRMDKDGYFYLVDRLKDVINVSGFKVIPREVEEVLFAHPKILEAVVAGVPDPYRGETVKAYIVLQPGESPTSEEMIAFCRERLAAFKVPTQIEFRSALPKTMVGKVLRRVLVAEESLTSLSSQDLS